MCRIVLAKASADLLRDSVIRFPSELDETSISTILRTDFEVILLRLHSFAFYGTISGCLSLSECTAQQQQTVIPFSSERNHQHTKERKRSLVGRPDEMMNGKA